MLSEKQNKLKITRKDLKLKDEEKTELILEKLLWKLFNTGLSGDATDALKMEQSRERAMK